MTRREEDSRPITDVNEQDMANMSQDTQRKLIKLSDLVKQANLVNEKILKLDEIDICQKQKLKEFVYKFKLNIKINSSAILNGIFEKSVNIMYISTKSENDNKLLSSEESLYWFQNQM